MDSMDGFILCYEINYDFFATKQIDNRSSTGNPASIGCSRSMTIDSNIEMMAPIIHTIYIPLSLSKLRRKTVEN